MLKKHLRVISLGLMAICSYEMLQASQHEQLEDYSADFVLDADSLTDVLSNFDDTNGLDKEPDYQCLRCDKREDRELALLRARRAEKQMHEDVRLQTIAELRLAVMKRLEHQHDVTASTKSELSLPSSSESNSISTLSSPDSIQRPGSVQRQVAMTFVSDLNSQDDVDSQSTTPDNQDDLLAIQYPQFFPIVHTELSSMRTRAGSSPAFSQLDTQCSLEESLSSHEELVVENIEDSSSDYVAL